MILPTLSIAVVVAATTTFSPLNSPEAVASSFLQSTWNRYVENYHPSYVLDGDPKTAWVEGVDGDGIGERITLPLSTVSSARTLKLSIKNGYQKNKDLLTANGAPKQITIIVVDDTGAQTAKQTAVLTRTMGAQDVLVPLDGKGVAAVTVVIDSVEPGRVYKDTCISDIAVFVDSDVRQNKKAEAAKKAALLAWKKERVATAKYFAKLPKTWPWASTTFDTKGRGLALAQHADATGKLLPAYAGVNAMVTAKLPVLAPLSDDDRTNLTRVVAVRDGLRTPTMLVRRIDPVTVPRLPDGLFTPPGLEALLLKTELSFGEPATSTKRTRSFADTWGTSFGTTVTGDAVVDGNDVFLPVTTIIDERTISTTTAWWLLRYDDAGRLTSLTIVKKEAIEHGRMIELPGPGDLYTEQVPGEAFEIVRFSWNAANKITKLDGFIGRVACSSSWLDHENDDEPGTADDDVCAYRVSSRTAAPYTGPR